MDGIRAPESSRATSEAGRNPLGWGGVGRLVRLLAGEPGDGERELDPVLRELAADLGLDGLIWFPEAPGEEAIGSEAAVAKRVDWGVLDALGPAQVHRVGAEDRRRSPRWAAGAGVELYAHTGDAVEPAGILGLTGAAGEMLPAETALALTDAIASFAGRCARRAAGEVARREQVLGRRVATVSHDLRNQLTLGLLELARLREEGGGEERSHEELERLELALSAARELCAATLSGEEPPPRRRLLLRTVLLEEARAAQTLAGEPGDVAVRARCPASLAVRAELSTLSRLTRNLILNALQACPAGAEVRVSAEARPEGRVSLVVEDGGRGMAVERVEELLRAGKSGAGGTGYGTTSLFECLEELGASLSLETAPGEGTRVEVRLSGMPEEGVPLALVVADDGRRRWRWGAGLAGGGGGLLEANSPRSALAELRTSGLDLVLIARGTAGDGLVELRQQARALGLTLRSVGWTGSLAAEVPSLSSS